MRRASITVVVVLLATALRAQSGDQKPVAFEVASVKANTSGDDNVAMIPSPNDHNATSATSLRLLICC